MKHQRAKNVVFVFGADPKPTEEQIRAKADKPDKDIEIHRVSSHQEVCQIVINSPTAWQHFATKSIPEETIEFLGAKYLVIFRDEVDQ